MYVNYDYYRIFYYVGKYKSISRAAKILENSQPNVTRAMNNLEAQLGCRLLVRSTKGVGLTEQGKKLYEHVEVAVEHFTAGEREIASLQALETGELFIAATEVALHGILLKALQVFRQKYPGIHIRVSNYSTPEAIEAVRKEHAELAAASVDEIDIPGVTCIPLKEYTECLTAGNDYSTLSGKELSLKELTGYPWISLKRETQTFKFYDRFFMKHGLSFEPDLQAATMDQIPPMVMSGLGLSFLPEFIAEPEIEAGRMVRLKLKEQSPARKICMVYGKRRTLSAPAVELLKVMRSMAEDKRSFEGRRIL